MTVADDDQMESLVLDAGGLELNSVVGDGRPISPEQLTFEVLQQDETGELVTVVPNAAPGRVLRLSAGTYHVVSRYGSVNAVVRADIQVEAGKLTQATMRHTGAEVTLKLVSAEGGEALANTSWTVTTQDGHRRATRASARSPRSSSRPDNTRPSQSTRTQIYSRDFTVEAGLAARHRSAACRPGAAGGCVVPPVLTPTRRSAASPIGDSRCLRRRADGAAEIRSGGVASATRSRTAWSRLTTPGPCCRAGGARPFSPPPRAARPPA